MDSEGEIIEVWDLPQLMGKSVSFRGLPADGEGGANGNSNGEAPPSPRKSFRREKSSKAPKDNGIDKLMLWGQPGHLTPEEADVYVSSLLHLFI